jgi:hypothetical protein
MFSFHERRTPPLQCCAAGQLLLSLPLLGLTCKATFKLGCICALVVWLMKKERLPSETPRVLSKLAFNVTIPCMLITKTAETLARTQGDWRYLMVPLAAAIQVSLHSSISLVFSCCNECIQLPCDSQAGQVK